MPPRVNITKERIIKDLKKLPDEMLPEIASILTLLKERYKETNSSKKIRQLLKTHKKVRLATNVSKVSWANEVRKGRTDRIQIS